MVGVGWRLGRVWPLPLPAAGAGEWGRTLGTAAVVAGLGLTIAAAASFRRARTSIVPVHPSTALVARGPYRFTRNPMYLGLAVATGGTALLLGDLWVLLLLVPALVVADRAFICPEERYLTRTFGDAYDAYRASVRRWL